MQFVVRLDAEGLARVYLAEMSRLLAEMSRIDDSDFIGLAALARRYADACDALGALTKEVDRCPTK